MDSETRGIWCNPQPIIFEGMQILLLDTEGFNSVKLEGI